MSNNKWHFVFDEETHYITIAITSWTPEGEDAVEKMFFSCTKEQIKLAFVMIEIAYQLNLIEVK